MMKEMHGIPNAVKVAAVSDDTQHVLVRDSEKLVHLVLGTSSYPAALTPEQARFIAKKLNESASRVEKKHASSST